MALPPLVLPISRQLASPVEGFGGPKEDAPRAPSPARKGRPTDGIMCDDAHPPHLDGPIGPMAGSEVARCLGRVDPVRVSIFANPASATGTIPRWDKSSDESLNRTPCVQSSMRRPLSKRGLLIFATSTIVVVGIGGIILMQRSGNHLVQALGVPSYFASGPDWDRLTGVVPGVGAVIVNPSNGPGRSQDPGYVTQVARSKMQGIAVLGYVATDHGHRDVNDAIREIDAYYAWYGVDGVFFDQASTDCASLPFYSRLHAEVEAKGGKALTVLNPGMMTDECFMGVADIVVTFEDTYRVYTTAYRAPQWTAKYNPDRFWHLVYDAPTETDMRRAVKLAKDRRVKWIYVTPASMPNPWGALPAEAYWRGELDAIK
jgi:hypothetical protein